MTGIVLWSDSEHVETDAIQLEFAYVRYSDIVKGKKKYDWDVVEKLLDSAASRRHQMILRFHFVYPGKPSAEPKYIRELSDYKPVTGKSEGKETGFCDWSHPELQQSTLDFYDAYAAKYDKDPRVGMIQTGFGLWAEYHIYSGPMKLGHTFPDHAYQERFVRHLSKVLKKTPWTISVDAANDWAPFAGNSALLALPFGVADDSFMGKQHAKENVPNWNAMDRSRWQRAIVGGEFSYYTDHDQKKALASKGPHGTSFEKAAAEFHLSFIIGNDQPEHQKMDRIKEASMACGYRFQVTSFTSASGKSEVTITNTGIAPIYHDAYVTVDGTRSTTSLKGLLPGQSLTSKVSKGSAKPTLTIESDRLVSGQRIEFEANLNASGS